LLAIIQAQQEQISQLQAEVSELKNAMSQILEAIKSAAQAQAQAAMAGAGGLEAGAGGNPGLAGLARILAPLILGSGGGDVAKAAERIFKIYRSGMLDMMRMLRLAMSRKLDRLFGEIEEEEEE